MHKDVIIEELMNDEHAHIFIDVRSPGEFEESTIPGAVNVPLFTNDERAEVGTIYKQIGPDQAKRRGIEIVSPKIPHLISSIEQYMNEDKIPVIFCWRGGMRSKAIATFLDFANLPSKRVEGGYRAYRDWVKSNLEHFQIEYPVVVLHGLTGVGKTDILQGMRDEYAVIDLEEMAGHRGSSFGSIGLIPRNQKMFENLLWARLREIKHNFENPVVLLEAESKRVGRVHLPDFIMKAKATGHHIMVQASLEKRVDRLVSLYTNHFETKQQSIEEIGQSLRAIEKKMSPATKKLLHESLAEGDFKTIATVLINEYYDPRYAHMESQYEGTFHHVQADNIDEAIQSVKSFINQITQLEMV